MHTVYRIGPQDAHVVDEFDRNPIGHHSPDLQRVLNVVRGGSTENKYVLVCTTPHKEWVLGQLSGHRGSAVKILGAKVYTNVLDAEREVFRLRWKQHTGNEARRPMKDQA